MEYSIKNTTSFNKEDRGKMKPDPHKQEKSRKYQAKQKSAGNHGKTEAAEKIASLPKANEPSKKPNESIKKSPVEAGKIEAKKKITEPKATVKKDERATVRKEENVVKATVKKPENVAKATVRKEDNFMPKATVENSGKSASIKIMPRSEQKTTKKVADFNSSKRKVPAQQQVYLMPEEEDENDVEIKGSKLKSLLEQFDRLELAENPVKVEKSPVETSTFFSVNLPAINKLIRSLDMEKQLFISGSLSLCHDEIISRSVSKKSEISPSASPVSKKLTSKATVIVKLPSKETSIEKMNEKKNTEAIDSIIDDILG